MKKNLLVILFCFFVALSACDQKQNFNLRENIKGDWKLDSVKGVRLENPLLFVFQDSTCAYLSPYGEFSPYKLYNDTLEIRERIHKRRNKIFGGNIYYLFTVDSLNSDRLVISPLTEESKSLFNEYYLINGKVGLNKIKPKNDYEVLRLGFYSTGCFGSCPSMYLEIDQNGDFLFQGIFHTDVLGPHSAKISRKGIDQIIKKIRSVDLKNIESNYSASYTDGQTCGIIIETKEGKFKTTVYGFDEEPVELRLLFHTLMEQYKQLNLISDSNVLDKIKYKEFSQNVIRILAPIPSKPNKE